MSIYIITNVMMHNEDVETSLQTSTFCAIKAQRETSKVVVTFVHNFS